MQQHLAGITSLASSSSMFSRSKQLKCLFPTQSSMASWRMEATPTLSGGLRKEKDGLLQLNPPCPSSGISKKVSTN